MKFVIFFLVVLFLSVNMFSQETKKGNEVNEKVSEYDSKTHPKDAVSIIGVGDIMLGTNFPSADYLPINKDDHSILEQVTPILKDADISFGNLEGVLLSGEGELKKCKNPKTCYAFKSPDSYAEHLKNAGFDVLSLANNHVNDFGEIGRNNTIRLLKEQGIAFAGLKTHPFSIFQKDSITYGFCAFSPNKGTMSIHDYKKIETIIKHLDSLSDIVIVSFHGGAEGSKYRHITRENEIFLGEDRGNPYEFSRKAIDAGADIIFGHGPHVTRSVDLYKDRFIIYSMGNFATYGRFNLRGSNGLAPIVKIYTDKKGVFLKGEIMPIKQIGRGVPVLDGHNGVIKEIIELTATDIPECNLNISETGLITIK